MPHYQGESPKEERTMASKEKKVEKVNGAKVNGAKATPVNQGTTPKVGLEPLSRDIRCPECKVSNPGSRATCEVCGTPLYGNKPKVGGAKMVETRPKVVHVSNKGVVLDRGARAKNKPPVRNCPCCGMPTRGGFFVMGHDGRIKGWFVQASKKDKKLAEVLKKFEGDYDPNIELLGKIYKEWVKDPKAALKDIVAKVKA